MASLAIVHILLRIENAVTFCESPCLIRGELHPFFVPFVHCMPKFLLADAPYFRNIWNAPISDDYFTGNGYFGGCVSLAPNHCIRTIQQLMNVIKFSGPTPCPSTLLVPLVPLLVAPEWLLSERKSIPFSLGNPL